MKAILELSELYSDAIWGSRSHERFKMWAFEMLYRNDYGADIDVACLASAQDEHESMALVRCILAKRAPTLLNQLELDESDLRESIYCSFPMSQPPQKITDYENDDSTDYDDEGQSVSDYFMAKRWGGVDLVDCGGYLMGYMNDRSLEYYLPAFLIMVINGKKVKTDIFQRFFSFCAGERESDRKKFDQIIAKLDAVQRQVLRQVLRYGVSQSYLDVGIKRLVNERTKNL